MATTTIRKLEFNKITKPLDQFTRRFWESEAKGQAREKK